MPRRTTSRYNDENVDQEEEHTTNNVKAEEDDATSHHQHHRHHKRKKVALMSESQQTDSERRQLRREQRSLQRDITSTNLGDDMEDPNKDAFSEVRGKNNELWNNVRYTREAVLDAENVDLIAERAARQVDRLIQVARYDAGRLSQKLRSKCTSRGIGSSPNFDWVLLGVEAGACFNSTPSRVSFLCGPIDTTYVPKERKKAQRRRTEEDDVEKKCTLDPKKLTRLVMMSTMRPNRRCKNVLNGMDLISMLCNICSILSLSRRQWRIYFISVFW
uniref:Non-structural maintenance of chromosomes element 4 n=1 Tax=Ditylum brightwellii TaxID=49249 RepID=A0A7S4VDK9_9STRA